MKNAFLVIGLLAIGLTGAYSVGYSILKEKQAQLVVSIFAGCSAFSAALYFFLHPL